MLNDLAFQAQFLAQHASFEAARSGSIGRSLALIALEVRRLGQRCGLTTHAIRNLLDTPAAALELTQVALTDLTLRQLVDAIARVHDLIAVVTSSHHNEPLRPVARAGAAAARERHILLLAQLASATRTLEARCTLLGKAMQALQRHVPATQTPSCHPTRGSATISVTTPGTPASGRTEPPTNSAF